MKRLTIVLVWIFSPAILLSQTYRIDWYVISSGGGNCQSSNYQLSGTIGQPIVGHSSSSSFQIDAGFWVGAAPAGPSCNYVIGDANNSISFNGVDVVYSVSYFKGGLPPPYSCECTSGHTWYVTGDVNASCNFNGVDVTYMVSYFKGGAPPHPCADCPPAGLLAPPTPGNEPTPGIEPAIAPVIKPGGHAETSD